MTTTADLDLGGRVAYWRRRQGLSQKQFGELCGHSESWAWRIENGYPVDRISTLLEIRDVLKLRSISQLIGNDIIPAALDEGPEHASVPALRRALHTPPSLQAAEALELGTLTEQVAEAWTIYNEHTIRYEVLASVLPRLLAQAFQTVRAADAERVDAIRQCVSLLHLAQIYLRRVGSLDVSELAASRAMAMADEISDSALISASAWNLCSPLISGGHVEEARDLALSTIDRYPVDGDSPAEHVSVHGALHLRAAIASVRAGEGPSAWDHLREAERYAESVPNADDLWHTSFCTTNVEMHRVHLAAEEGAHDEALRYADNVADNPSLPLERRTRYLIEVMHSHRVRGDDLGALFMAQKIVQLSPEEAVYHTLVRSTAAHLLKHERPTYRTEVRELATHVGVLH